MVKVIELSQGKITTVDDDDYKELNEYKWHCGNGYARRNIRLPDGKRKLIFLHRVIAKTPEGKYTDHINGDPLDNRKENLRNVYQHENAKNARKRTKGNSKFKGVSYFKRKQDSIGKWKAKIQIDGEQKNLGYFKSEIQAAIAYNEAATKYFGEYAVMNEVETMYFKDYQEASARTIPKEKWFNTNVSNFSMGLAGEVGEVVDILKKVIHHGHELNKDEVKKELGDVLWYLSALSTTLNIDLDDIAKENIEKLKKRYPEGFSKEASVNRNDD